MCGHGSPIITEEVKNKIAAWHNTKHEVSRSPFGPQDEIGMLNLSTASSRQELMGRMDATHIFDMSVDYFVNMPSWTGSGDLGFQIWLSHTPSGSIHDDPAGIGGEAMELISYSGDSIALYTHTGTHLDSLNHYGYHHKIWNGFTEKEHMGRTWYKAGADKIPPIIGRGILIDVAAALGVEMLPDSYAIGEKDLSAALKRQGIEPRVGDIMLVRTGRMSVWPDTDKYIFNSPGLNREGAEFLTRAGAMVIGSDNIAVEQMPAVPAEEWPPVHTYLLAEAGVPMIELLDLEALSAEKVYEFAFVGACLKLRGATGSPIRPLALPLRD
jgi:kynurenine formamidase